MKLHNQIFFVILNNLKCKNLFEISYAKARLIRFAPIVCVIVKLWRLNDMY